MVLFWDMFDYLFWRYFIIFFMCKLFYIIIKGLVVYWLRKNVFGKGIEEKNLLFIGFFTVF